MGILRIAMLRVREVGLRFLSLVILGLRLWRLLMGLLLLLVGPKR